MANQQINLFHIPFKELFEIIRMQYPASSYDFGKHQVYLNSDSGASLGFIRLPLHISIDGNFRLRNKEINILYISIESGNATLAMNKGEKTILHS
ncbi:MAG: hypothetical protein AAFQ94_26950, partial [Bacteroidota bacterium]